MIRAQPRGTPGALNCLQVGRVLQRYLDGELDTAKAAMVALHLDDCRRCGMAADEFRRIKSALSDIGHDEAAIDRLRRFATELTENPAASGEIPEGGLGDWGDDSGRPDR